MDSPTTTLIHLLRNRVDELVAAGDLDEAVHAATAAVLKAQQSLSSDLDSIDEFASSLEVRGDVYRLLGRFEEARDDYKQAIDQLDNRPDRCLQLGRLHAGYGSIHDQLDHADRAKELWQQAIRYFETADPPASLDIASMSNNLAVLKRNEGDTEGAEAEYLKALEILHRELGADHEETAAVCNNIGALYQSAGLHEQAREMHMMALEARRKNFGDNHHDTAQSHNNLALALLATGDSAWARRHFEKAVSGFEALGVEYASDLQAVAENYCAVLQAEGDYAHAETIAARVPGGMAMPEPELA
jgi:tetratricopeptide (TPR) repeat protein